jgi:hypothetical protein
MQITLPGASTVSYAMHYPARDAAASSHTVTTRYRSSYGIVRLQLAQSPAEKRIGLFLNIAIFLRRTLGFQAVLLAYAPHHAHAYRTRYPGR